ncbi:MAG TPA: PD-(D/E)XK nuclease family protein [Candidatus Paceibacterota bacterium]
MQHISFSQYSSYKQCPRAWYLGKVKHAEEKQTWYLPLGSAVHTSVEKYLATGEVPSFESVFYPLIEKQMLIEPDLDKWMAGGSQQDPIVKGKAVQLGKDCVEKALTFLDDIDVWEVEYDASGNLPGLVIPLKAFVDVIGEHKKHGPSIVDWKSSASKPKDNFQLETYRALLDCNKMPGDVALPNIGLWAMVRPTASKARPVDLSKVDPAEVGAKYQAVYEAMQKKIYKTQQSYNCKFCFHQDNCLLVAGRTDRAKYYDKAHEDGLPY